MNRTELRIVLAGFAWRALLIAGVLYATGCTDPEPPVAPVARCTGAVAGTAFGAPASGVIVVREQPVGGYVFEDLEVVLNPPPPEWRELSIRLGVQWSRAASCADIVLDGWRLDEFEPNITVSHSLLNYNASGDIDTALALSVYGELLQPARLGETSPDINLIVEECVP